MYRPRFLTLLVYATVVSALGFILRDPLDLLVVLTPALVLDLIYAKRGLKWIVLGVLVGLIGLFINALAFSNTGEVVVKFYVVEVRRGAIDAFITVSLRLLVIACAGALIALVYNPVEVYRSLVYEIKTPVLIALPIAYALRMLPIVKRDHEELVFQRKQRGLRVNPLNPLDFASIAMTLMAVNYERAKWSGISAELRGLRYIKPRFKYEPRLIDLLVLALLVTQLILFVYI